MFLRVTYFLRASNLTKKILTKKAHYFFTESLYLYLSVTGRKEMRQGTLITNTRKSLFVSQWKGFVTLHTIYVLTSCHCTGTIPHPHPPARLPHLLPHPPTAIYPHSAYSSYNWALGSGKRHKCCKIFFLLTVEDRVN